MFVFILWDEDTSENRRAYGPFETREDTVKFASNLPNFKGREYIVNGNSYWYDILELAKMESGFQEEN